MKILLVHNYYQQRGGEFVAVKAQISLLKSKGLPLVTYLKDNAAIDEFGARQRIKLLKNALFNSQVYQEISSLIEDQRPDVAHVHNVFPLLSPTVYYALRDQSIPIVQTVHNFRFLCPNGLFYTHNCICEKCKFGNTLHAIRLKCYRQSYILSSLYATIIGLHRRIGTFSLIDRFIALTEFTANRLIESQLTTSDSISVLGNFLSDPLPKTAEATSAEPYIVFMGRLSREKGVQIAIRAMLDLPEVTLKIFGSGPQLSRLRNIVKEHGLNNVEFLGYIEGDRKWDILRHARATLIPSLCYETFSITALESMSVATPVIGSRLGSLPFVVEDGQSGLLFTPGDPNDLVDKISYLIQDRKKAIKMGKYGRDVVEQKYTAMSHYETLVSIYTSVLS